MNKFDKQNFMSRLLKTCFISKDAIYVDTTISSSELDSCFYGIPPRTDKLYSSFS
jgi:hypothetical protein